MTGSEACRQALFALIDGRLTAPVYDEPPEGSTFPYVTIGDAVETARNAFGATGREIVATLDVWSRSGPDAAQDGYGEAQTIAGEIDALLDDSQPADTGGWRFVSCDTEQLVPLRDPDGITRHISCSYRCKLEAL